MKCKKVLSVLLTLIMLVGMMYISVNASVDCLVADNIIDCTGLMVIPGMIDMHCHLRQPAHRTPEPPSAPERRRLPRFYNTRPTEKRRQRSFPALAPARA